MKTNEIKVGNRISIGTAKGECAIEFVGIVTKIEDCKVFMQVMELYNCVYSNSLEDVEDEDIAILDLRTNILSGNGFEIILGNSYEIFSEREVKDVDTIRGLKDSIKYLLMVIGNNIDEETDCKKLKDIKNILEEIDL